MTSTEKAEVKLPRQRLEAEAGDDAQEENDEINIGELPFENEFELDDGLNLEQTITNPGADAKPKNEDDYEHDGHEDEQHQVQDREEISLLYLPDTAEQKNVEMDESDVNKERSFDPAEALVRFYNEVGLVTNLLAFYALSVLMTTPHLEAASSTHQLADTTSLSTKSPDVSIQDSNIFDILSLTTRTDKIEDLVIKALSMITYIGILPEYHFISQKSLPRTIDTAERTLKKQKNASIAPKTVKGKKWRCRVLARKEKRKQKRKQKERKLRMQATASKDVVERENETGSFSKKDIVEKSSYPQCTNNYDYLDFILQSDEEDDEDKTEEKVLIERPSYPQDQGANNYDYLGCILNSGTNQILSDNISLICSEDDGDVQTNENGNGNENEFAQLVVTPGSVYVRWEEGPTLVQEEEIEGKSSALMSSSHSRFCIPCDILSIEESLEQSFADALREITEDAEDDIPQSSEDCLSFVTAEDTVEEKESADTIRDITINEVDILQPNEDYTPFVTAEDVAKQIETLNNMNRTEQKSETNRSNGIQSSLATETKQDDENVCIETILDAQRPSSKVEVVVYGHDMLSPASKPSFWCSWFEAFSWNSLQFSLPDAFHEKKGSGHSDSSLCLTETLTNSSSNSSSWLSFGAGIKKDKNQPWYIMPEFDSETNTLDTAFLEGLPSLCTSNTEWNSIDEYTNTTSEEDEGFVLSRMSIVREFNRIRNDDSLCHSDRVMEMIYFSTTPAPQTRTSVNGLVLD